MIARMYNPVDDMAAEGGVLVDIQTLRYLVTLCDTRSFSKTAELHYISTSACSRKIRNLEEELGCELFLRNSHSVTPTAAGMEMRDVARRMIQMVGHLDKNSLRGEEGTCGQIGVALDFLDCGTEIEADLKEFLRQHPQIELVFKSATMTQIETGLLDHTYDAGLLIRPAGYEHQHFKCVQLKKMGVIACVHKDHPLANRNSIALDDLLDWEIILFDRNRSPYIYDHIIRELYRKISLTWIRTVDTVNLMQTMCSVNRCVGICFPNEIRADKEKFRTLPICGVSDAFEYVFAIKKGLSNACVQQLYEMLEKNRGSLQNP